MKPPSFTQLRPSEPVLARVERNLATTLDGYAQLLSRGLTLSDNARGTLLTLEGVVVPLASPVVLNLGKGASEPQAVALVSAISGSTRFSGGGVRWIWGVEQGIGRASVAALSSDIPAGTYTAIFFVLGG